MVLIKYYTQVHMTYNNERNVCNLKKETRETLEETFRKTYVHFTIFSWECRRNIP